ncbi:MAG TPA: hypothetical protein VFG18_11425 [Xanthomonadaceae bacterium]|nr:hypothetical protein [Xanthomonadaceae bacterium]
MLCAVYCTESRRMLLVPSCMRATLEAETTFGPMHDCGFLDTSDLPLALQDSIERELIEQSFVALAETHVASLGLGKAFD